VGKNNEMPQSHRSGRNKTDYEAEFVPRIGERILLEYGIGSDPVRPHYFRVKDVMYMYRLDNKPENQVAILIERRAPRSICPTESIHWVGDGRPPSTRRFESRHCDSEATRLRYRLAGGPTVGC
jgi:hypothetical protein